MRIDSTALAARSSGHAKETIEIQPGMIASVDIRPEVRLCWPT